MITYNNNRIMQRHFTNNLRMFDVTLRDGLQSTKAIMSLKQKKDLADFIYHTYRPSAMEVGSIVSSKYVPQMKDSLEVYKHCVDNKFSTDLYMLTPNISALEIAKKAGIKNFSFITSVSESFQKKNTNKTIDETKGNMKEMFKCLELDDKVKIYISCIDECPIEGKISVYNIASELYYYIYNFCDVNEICLSDTCGTLTESKFIEIIQQVYGNVSFGKLSLHLHKNKEKNDAMSIINKAKTLGIRKFDVSAIENMGGCAMTIDSNKSLPSNIHYRDVDEEYDFFKRYIEMKYKMHWKK